jgi:SAM-dependent methyltransferase
VQLVCTTCHTPLTARHDSFECPACGSVFAVAEGVPVFYPQATLYRNYDDIWELDKEFCAPTLFHRFLGSALKYWTYRERVYAQRHLVRGGDSLDLGCWTGSYTYARLSRTVTGIDLTLSAAQVASHHYNFAVQGSVACLPFAAGSFDCVVSAHLIGHVPAANKDAVVAEIHRVLKPGGKSVHFIETDSENIFVRRAKRDPDLYQKYFVERVGHNGLELPSVILKRFQRQGFVVEDVTKMDSGILPPWYYLWYLDNEYTQRQRALAGKVRLARVLCRTRVGNLTLGVLYGIYHRSWEQWFTRLDDSMHISLTVKKPS